MLDATRLKQDFPILHQEVNDEPLVYLDNAASTQMPLKVMNELKHFKETDYANVHRGVHTLSERATSQYEAARDTVSRFLGAKSTKEILFTRGTTTSLNWVAQSLGDLVVEKGDKIVISYMEHHSNIVPWQQLAKRKEAELIYINLTPEGFLDMTDAKSKITDGVKIVSITHASNVLGVVNDVKTLGELAHSVGAKMVVDGAQSTPHMRVNVTELNCDFYAFSAHKMCGPTGIGVLYGRQELLEKMEPVEYGGEMIDFVYDQRSTWAELPYKFEAGTPNITGAIGLAYAIDYLEEIGLDNIHQHEQELVEYALPKLLAIDGFELYGPKDVNQHTGVIAFNIEGIHPHDLSTALDMQGVAIRAGHHCAQPLLRYLDVMSTARASFYFYNTKEDADCLVQSIIEAKEFFQDGFI